MVYQQKHGHPSSEMGRYGRKESRVKFSDRRARKRNMVRQEFTVISFFPSSLPGSNSRKGTGDREEGRKRTRREKSKMGDVRVNPFEPELRSVAAFLRSIPVDNTTSEGFTRDYLRGFLHLDVELDYVLQWNADGCVIDEDSDLPPETLARVRRTIFVCYAIYKKLFEIGPYDTTLIESFFTFHPHLPVILMNLSYHAVLRRYPDASMRVLGYIPTVEKWIKERRAGLFRLIFQMRVRNDCWHFINNSIEYSENKFIGEHANAATLDILLENGYAPNWHTLHGALSVHNVYAARKAIEFGVLQQGPVCDSGCCTWVSPAFKCFTSLNLEIMDLCFAHGGNPHDLSPNKENVFHVFFKNVTEKGMKNSTEGVRRLISYGVRLDMLDKVGRYPLFYANFIDLEGVKLLVEAGADVNRIDNTGRNVMTLPWREGVRDYFRGMGIEANYKY